MLAVDEKPHIQALERAQGYLKLRNGRSLRGHGSTYKRHGTTTLFAALNVATARSRPPIASAGDDATSSPS